MRGIWGERGVVADPVPGVESGAGAAAARAAGGAVAMSSEEAAAVAFLHRRARDPACAHDHPEAQESASIVCDLSGCARKNRAARVYVGRECIAEGDITEGRATTAGCV